MKTKFYLLVFLLPVLAWGQENNVPPFVVENVSLIPPAFTGLENGSTLIISGQVETIQDYLNRNIQYPDVAEECYIQGTAVVQFVVTKDGELTDFNIVNSVCQSIDDELIRVLKTTDRMWKPGFSNDTPADMEKEISMMFVAKNENRDNAEKYFTKIATSNYLKANELFLAKNKAKKALKYYNNSIKYLPFETASLMARGLCKYQLGDTEGALVDWKRINAIGKYDMKDFVDHLSAEKGYAEMIKTLDQNNP